MTDKVGLKDIKRMYAESSAIAKLLRQRKDHPEPKTSNKANEELRQIAYNYAKNFEGFKAEASDLTSDEIIAYANADSTRLEREYSHYFSSNIDGIISEVPKEDLEGLVQDERVRKNTDDKGRKAISEYVNYRGLEELARGYEGGSREFSKEQASVVQNAQKRASELYVQDIKKKAVEAEKARQAKLGIKDKLYLETVENLFNMALKMGRIDIDEDKIEKQTLNVIREQVAVAKARYSALDSSDDGTPLRNALTKAVNNMVKSGEPRSYREAVALIAG